MAPRLGTSRWVEGGGGLRLYVEDSGNPRGRPIVFFHGFSQNHLVWRRQTESDLAEEFRLLAVDLRGHGKSDKPPGVYGDSKLWAGDVSGVVRGLELDHPILVGWSYSGLLLCDYARHYGQEAIGGLVFVGAVTRTGGKESFAELGEEFVALVRPTFSNAVGENQAAVEKLIRLTTKGALSEEEFYLFLGFNGVVPPYVREGMMKRKLSNDDLLPNLRKPVLIVHGTEDRVVLPQAAERHAAMIPEARLRMYPGTGHSPFWENAGQFNEDLREFARSI